MDYAKFREVRGSQVEAQLYELFTWSTVRFDVDFAMDFLIHPIAFPDMA